MMMGTGDLVARLRDSGTDPLGRWSYQTYSGKNDVQVTFVLAYQVCKKVTKGTVTAAAQQEALLRKRGIQDPQP